MKTLSTGLLKSVGLLLFPMILVACTVLAKDTYSLEDPSFKTVYRIVPQRARLLNKRQIGVYFRITDNRGLDHRANAATIGRVQLNEQTIPFWRLGWRPIENPFQTITALNGYNRYFGSANTGPGLLNQNFFQANRLANRIEIRPFQGKSIAEGYSDPTSLPDTNLIEQIGQKLLSGNGSSRQAGYQVIWNSRSVEKLKELLSERKMAMTAPGKYLNTENLPDKKTSIVLNDLPRSTESRQVINYLKHHLIRQKTDIPATKQHIDGKPQKQPPVFSKIREVVFVDATIIDQTTQTPKKEYHYRPQSLHVTAGDYPVSGSFGSYLPEIKSYFDCFETEMGSNILIVDISRFDLSASRLELTAQIETPDKTLHAMRTDLVLEKGDRDLVKHWKNPDKTSPWIELDQRFKRLFADKDFQAYIALTTEVFPKGIIKDEAPLPLAGEWVYFAAESYRELGKTAEAMAWYRKVVNEFPYADNYTNAWYKLTEQNMGGQIK